ncbi:aldose epimerase family protein [Streptacidiphilus monticola]|uniref:Aldose 1-epimerase n=1 Tax=Streptacidiphilus monticola TaxID=2161674 RepID=A0ABW1G3U2_9ACTN
MPTASHPSLTRAPFGRTPDSIPVELWTLDSGTGLRAQVLSYGGILHRLEVPDRDGRPDTVVLGLPTAEDYAAQGAYLGALVGRYANRIAGGAFRLDGRTHRIPAQDRGHALHGGPDGFHRRHWSVRPGPVTADAAGLLLRLRSPDGDMGFPGTLDVQAGYTLRQDGVLAVEFTARCDRPTVVNLTHHAYFNLGGPHCPDVLGHRLQVEADGFLPVTADAIPLPGAPAPVDGTPFDLRKPGVLGELLAAPDPQLHAAGGYDHCWTLRPAEPDAPGGLRRAAVLAEPGTGRTMEVWTSEPGLQVYTGNALDGSLAGPDGRAYGRHAGLCLETQHFPDAPNRPDYPTTELRPGQLLRSRTEFRFPAHIGPGL